MEPLSTDITKDDFTHCGWEMIVAGCDKKECRAYSWHFGAKAREAEEAGDEKSQQIFDLLRDITSMHMKLDNPEEPFGPLAELHDGRTAIVDDFDEARLKLLSEVVAEITDPELRARISDVLWIRNRDFRMAQLAVSSYLESATRLEDLRHWTPTYERIERALQLAVILGRNTGAYASVISHIERLLDSCGGEDPLFLSARLMTLLQERRAGDAAKYAAMAEKIALGAEAAHDWRRAREYWEVKARWHYMVKEEEQARGARTLAAETYVKEAEGALRREPPSYMHAAAFMQKAIAALRRVEGTKERARELHEVLLEYQEKSTSELIEYKSSVDASDIAKMATDSVKGKALQDALLSLAMLGASPKVEDLKEQAKENRDKYLFHRFFPNVYLNVRGRITAKQPKDEEETIQADMFKNATFFQSTHAQALVEPARRQILSEHYVRLDDFAPIVTNNPFIPSGRELIIARGLLAGLQGDFLSAAHFLIPQLEESVRYILFQLRVITSGLDDDGIQDEYNLNRMLSASEFSKPLEGVIGEDFVFDLRGLLVERFGTNLRNDMAHGLISYNAFYSFFTCYLWWLSLRFYSWPTFAKLTNKQASEGEAG